MNKQKILGAITKLATGLDVSEFFSELAYKKHLGFYDIFRTFFDDLIWTYLNWRFKLTQAEKIDDHHGALVIFIDDLDRCPKPRIVKVLDTIKLFMDHKGCVFVIGAARDIIVKALSKDYGEEDAPRFMEKIVQVTFNLPKVTDTMFEQFLDDLGEIPVEIANHLRLIMPAMGYNPRQLKRFVNNLNLRHGLMRSSGIAISFDAVLHWGIIEHAFPILADDLGENPNNLSTLQEHLAVLSDRLRHPRVWEADDTLLKELNVPQSFHKYLRNEPMIAILQSFKVGKNDFKVLLTFSASVESDETIKLVDASNRLEIQTESMVEILAGFFTFSEKRENVRIEVPYWIDVYLVTNARFKAFVEDGGYKNEAWWSTRGLQWRKEKHILRPDYWGGEKWNADDQPVVGVSWYEASAYCCWLTDMFKNGYTYHLPDEKQWERAARGTDGRIYPWGDDFDRDRCNTKESSVGKTTRIDRYANGLSPTGCYDMAGNVWEWTSSYVNFEKERYVVKGGSWNCSAAYARCSFRHDDYFGLFPFARDKDVGFRCARTKK